MLLLFVAEGFEFFRAGVAQYKADALTIGGPSEVLDILRSVGEALGFAAGTVEEPDLGFALVARGEEGEVFAVGTPARTAGGRAFQGHRNSFTAGGGNHPDLIFGFFVFQISAADRIGDPFGVWCELRVGDFLEAEAVFDGDGMRSLGEGCERENENGDAEQYDREQFHSRTLLRVMSAVAAAEFSMKAGVAMW